MDRNSDRKKDESKHTVVFDVSPKLAQLIEKLCVAINTNEIEKELKNIMANLDALVQGISDFRADTAAEKAEVTAAFEKLDTKISELTALVAAGQLDEAKVTQATADVATARDEVKGIFTPADEDETGDETGDDTEEETP